MNNYISEVRERLLGENRPTPTFTGEEGHLYRLEYIAGITVWAKQWYQMHNIGLSLDPKIGGALLSPYAVKSRNYQLGLARIIAPEHIVKPLGDFDPRISDTGIFDVTTNRPVSITKEPDSIDHARAEQIRRINQLFSDTSKEYKAGLREKGIAISQNEFFENLARRHNLELRDLVGPEVEFGFGPIKRPEDRDRLANSIRSKSRENVIPKLIQAGIFPAHHQVNFIPGHQVDFTKPPYGTFAELLVFDEERYLRFINQNFSSQNAAIAQRKLEEFIIYSNLDDIYNLCLVSNHRFKEQVTQKRIVELIQSTAIQTALKDLLKAIEERAKKDYFWFIIKLDELKIRIPAIVHREASLVEIENQLRRLAVEIKSA